MDFYQTPDEAWRIERRKVAARRRAKARALDNPKPDWLLPLIGIALVVFAIVVLGL